MDHRSLMRHCRKLVVRPINISDWIFDIGANSFVRHLIKVLKGSAGIAGQGCPQPGLKGEMLPPSPRAPAPPLPFSSVTARHHTESAARSQGSRWWEGQPGQAAEEWPSLGCLLGRLKFPGAGLHPLPWSCLGHPFSWAATGIHHQALGG